MENFQIVKRVGSGVYGDVHKVKDVRDDKFYALKTCVTTDKENLSSLLMEALVLSNCSHKNVLHCRNIFMEKNKILFQLDLCESSLSDLQEIEEFTTEKTKKCIKDILRGLQYIHEKGISHCDLKPENILYNSKTKSFVICDFNSSHIPSSSLYETPGCTRWYRAPESIVEQNFGSQTDIWAVGCILYELLTNSVLFRGVNGQDQIRKIVKVFDPLDYNEIVKYAERKGIEIKSKGIKETKVKDPLARDLLYKMLIIDPKKRISIQKALEHPYLN